MNNKQIIIIGNDLDLVDQMKLLEIKISVIDKKNINEDYYLGKDEKFQNKKFKDSLFIISLDDPEKKRSIFNKFYKKRDFFNFFAENSFISKNTKFGTGNIFQRDVKIMSNIIIGNHCKFNIDSTIHHDCEIGDFNTFCPGVRLLGNVKIGNNVFIGSGSTILPNIFIDDNVIVGAGSIVTRNIKKNTKVFGVPANEK